MKPSRKSDRKRAERQAGWQKTIEDLRRRPGIPESALRAYRMPCSNRRKRQ
jgi:hypothetical protein